MKTATTGRTRNNHMTTTDGPFAETKDQRGSSFGVQKTTL